MPIQFDDPDGGLLGPEEILYGSKNKVVNMEPISEATVVFLPNDDTGCPIDTPAKVDGRIRTVSSSLDPWALPEINLDEGKPWKEMGSCERVKTVFLVGAKIAAALALLYAFVCSLGILSQAFRLVGGRAAGKAFSNSALLQNPICGLMIGVLGTVLLQSSSTSTSIVVSMVAANSKLKKARHPTTGPRGVSGPLSLRPDQVADYNHDDDDVHDAEHHPPADQPLRPSAQGPQRHPDHHGRQHRNQHDQHPRQRRPRHQAGRVPACFCRRYRSRHVQLALRHHPPSSGELLSVITKPLTNLVIQLDKKQIKKVALGLIPDNVTDFTLIKHKCGMDNNTVVYCKHMFAHSNMSDSAVGVILLLLSLGALVFCLIFIVKVLNSLLKGKIAAAIRGTINNDFPRPFGFLTGYLAIVVGMVMTILVQSSSVFTSALTPLVGIGVLSLDRMFPLTLGANVGTTFTSVLAAMASPPEKLQSTLQIAFCHLFFNLMGILIFYPIPVMRKAPIGLAKLLGEKTSKYRWVAVIYVVVSFFLLPGLIFALSLAGKWVLIGVGAPILVFFTIVALINVLQVNYPRALPPFLRNWDWLPPALHSLAPADRLISSCISSIPTWARPCCPPSAESPGPGLTTTATASSQRHLLSLATSPAASAPASRPDTRAPSRSESPSRSRGSSRFRSVL